MNLLHYINCLPLPGLQKASLHNRGATTTKKKHTLHLYIKSTLQVKVTIMQSTGQPHRLTNLCSCTAISPAPGFLCVVIRLNTNLFQNLLS